MAARQSVSRWSWVVATLLAAVLCLPQAFAGAVPEKVVLSGDTPALPAYTFPYTNPLYGTIAGFLSIRDVELRNQKTYKLKIDSFKKKVPVKAIIQPNNAPLVVVLMGADGKAEGKLGRLWPAWYAEAGYHVLTFDSTFLPSFIEISGHGVTGNLPAEAERVVEIINAFLNMGEVKQKVEKIGIVGMSYGGIQAMLIGKMASEGRLPFKVDGIQSYSAPISLGKTGTLVDGWFNEDRWQFTLTELASKIGGHKIVGPNEPAPFSDSMMRAAISAAFRIGLVDVIVRNDRMYKLNLLPAGNNFDDEYVRREHAGTWGYQRFMAEVAFPYWKDKANYRDVQDMAAAIELPALLRAQPPYAEAIIAEDDPFNLPDDVAALKKDAATLPLTLLPTGGHLGYVNEDWTKAKLMTLFKPTIKQANATH